MFDKLIQKVGGLDKIAHFAVGALITFIISNIAILQDATFAWNVILGYTGIGAINAMLLEFIKEYVIDIKADKKDILATFLGTVLVFIVNLIGLI